MMTDYLVRLCQDRTTADSNASTPGELLLMDLIKGADHPKMVAQLHKIAIPTAESIKNCVIEFVSREQAAKGDGATDEVVFLAQVSPTARSGSFNGRDDHTGARNNSQSRSNARSRSRSISTSNRNMRCYRCNSSSHIQRDCNTDRKTAECSFCKSTGSHMTAACNKKKADETRRKNNRTTASSSSSSNKRQESKSKSHSEVNKGQDTDTDK